MKNLHTTSCRNLHRHSRKRRRLIHRKTRVETLEARQMLAADAASWVVDHGGGQGKLDVTEHGEVYVAMDTPDPERDVVVKRFSTTGDELWEKTFAGPGFSNLFAIDVDDSDPLNPEIYIQGNFEDKVDFGTAGVLQSAGEWDAFVAKLDANGNPIWAQRFGGNGSESQGSVAVHGSSVYVSGHFQSNVDFGGQTLYATGSDGYILKLDKASGSVQWVEQITGGGGSSPRDIEVTESGGSVSIYLSGYLTGLNDFGDTSLDGGDGQGYLAKLNDNGNTGSFVWAEQIVSGSADSLTADGSGGVFVAGSAAIESAFIMRVIDNGATATIDWVTAINSDEYADVIDISYDNGILFALPYIRGTATFDSTGGASSLLSSGGEGDTALARYDVNGEFLLLQQMSGSESDYASTVVAENGIVYTSVSTDSGNAILPASAPNAVFPDAFPNERGGRKRYLLKLNAEAPIVTTSPFIVSQDTTVTLTATAVASDFITDLSQSIVWTDELGNSLGSGSSINVTLDIGAHQITASAVDSVSGLIGISGTEVTVQDASQPIILFSDSFENGQWNGLWVEDSQDDWFTSTQRSTDGNFSAKVDGRATGATLSVATPIDMTAYTDAELSFDWYIESSVDSGEGIRLEFFDGSTWHEVLSLDGNVDQENFWHSELVQLDPQYLISDFQFRYSATMNRSNEDANVDNVQLIATPTGPPNQQPSITSTAVVSGTQDIAYAYDVDADDPDAGDTLTYSLDVAPSGMTIDSGTGVIDWTPSSSQVGDNNVTVQVQDQRGGSGMQSFVIDVANVNDPPSISSSPVTTGTEGATYTYDVSATDLDAGDTLSYFLDVMPTGMTINANTGLIAWTPGSGDVGAANTVTLRVTDLLGEFDTQTFSVDVSAPSGESIYVYDIRFDSKRSNKDWRAVFEIRSDSNGNGAGDAGDNPMAGVQVEVTFAGNTYSGVTDSNGIFRTGWIKNLSSGNHYANAVDLALAGYQWNLLSLDLEDDSDAISGPDALLVR